MVKKVVALVLIAMLCAYCTADVFVNYDAGILSVISFEDGGRVTYVQYADGVVLAPIAIAYGSDQMYEYSRMGFVTDIASGYTFAIEILGKSNIVKVKFWDLQYNKLIGQTKEYTKVG